MAILTRQKGLGFAIEYRDFGLKNILRGTRAFSGMRLHVGVVGARAAERTADGRLTNAENAAIQQYGLGDAPPRDFLNGPFVERKADVQRILAAAMRRAIGYFVRNGSSGGSRSGAAFSGGAVPTLGVTGTIEEVLDEAGRQLAQIPKDAISDGVPPPNAPATVKKKGFDKPLIDTLSLYQSISHRVVRESGDFMEAGATDFEAFEFGNDVNPNVMKIKTRRLGPK